MKPIISWVLAILVFVLAGCQPTPEQLENQKKVAIEAIEKAKAVELEKLRIQAEQEAKAAQRAHEKELASIASAAEVKRLVIFFFTGCAMLLAVGLTIVGSVKIVANFRLRRERIQEDGANYRRACEMVSRLVSEMAPREAEGTVVDLFKATSNPSTLKAEVLRLEAAGNAVSAS